MAAEQRSSNLYLYLSAALLAAAVLQAAASLTLLQQPSCAAPSDATSAGTAPAAEACRAR